MEVKTVSEIIEEVVPYYKKKGEPEAIHTLGYDSSSETLEPIYFFILDIMNGMGFDVKKYTDNFTSSPGSGHFQDLGTRASAMQQQASNLLGSTNAVVKSVLNILYDLKDLKIRLEHYDELRSDNKEMREAAVLALKQIWLDKVDISKGNSSIKGMALGQAGFQTLLTAFLAVKNEEDVKKLDLNDVVKRILKPRIFEFDLWSRNSEQELRKRYKLQRSYLKSQVNTLKLYSRWAKPYLKAAADLEMKESKRDANIVNVFNTILLELTLLGKSKINVKDSALAGDLPADLSKESILKTLKREYYNCILVDFVFRGIPSRMQTQQAHYTFGGKAEVTFKAYALNEDDILKIEQELEKSELNDVLGLVEGATTESLEGMQEEINMFLEEEEKEKKDVLTKSSRDNSNPFMALMGRYDSPKKSGDKDKSKESKKSKDAPLKKDDWMEKLIRKLAAEKAEKIVYDLFDVYKKAHGMPSFT